METCARPFAQWATLQYATCVLLSHSACTSDLSSPSPKRCKHAITARNGNSKTYAFTWQSDSYMRKLRPRNTSVTRSNHAGTGIVWTLNRRRKQGKVTQEERGKYARKQGMEYENKRGKKAVMVRAPWRCHLAHTHTYNEFPILRILIFSRTDLNMLHFLVFSQSYRLRTSPPNLNRDRGRQRVETCAGTDNNVGHHRKTRDNNVTS